MTLYIIAGANGSGKTTFAKKFASNNNLYFINADEIAKELDSNNLTKFKIKAGRIFFEEFDAKLLLEQSFMIETTLSGKYLVKYIVKAKKLGYKVVLIYLFLEQPSTNIARVKNRVIGGGHNIPKDDIIRRFYRSKNLFCEIYRDIVSSWSIYYNSDEIFEKVADSNKILDIQKYNKFKEDTKCK